MQEIQKYLAKSTNNYYSKLRLERRESLLLSLEGPKTFLIYFKSTQLLNFRFHLKNFMIFSFVDNSTNVENLF